MRRSAATDRLVTGVAGLVLVAAGLAAANWAFGWLWSWPRMLDLGSARSTVDADWFAWVLALVGVIVGLAGLSWWLRRLTPSPGRPVVSSESSDAGAIRIDLDSMAAVTASEIERAAPVRDARGSGRAESGAWLLEVRARTEEISDGPAIATALAERQGELDEAFGPGRVRCRLLLAAPRRARPWSRGAGTPRVH